MDYTLQTLIDQAKIRTLIDTYFLGLDTKTFELIRGTLTDDIVILGDYHDPVDDDGVVLQMTADEWIDKGPKRFIPGFDATAHISSNQIITVDGESAHARLTVYANHYIKPTMAEQAHYDIPANIVGCLDYIFIDYWLIRPEGGDWLIRRMRSRTVAETGNPEICFGISLKRSGREAG